MPREYISCVWVKIGESITSFYLKQCRGVKRQLPQSSHPKKIRNTLTGHWHYYHAGTPVSYVAKK